MKIEQLQLVNRNETSDLLLRIFASSNQISNQTNLESFINFLKKKGNIIDETLFFNFFKELQDAEVGFLTNWNGHRFTKFLWKYSLKDVSEQILYPNKMVKIRPAIEEEKEEETVIPENNMEKPKRRGRPKGSRNIKREFISETNIGDLKKEVDSPTVIKRRGRKPSGYKEKEVVFIFTTSKGNIVPFELRDAERLLQEIEKIKSIA